MFGPTEKVKIEGFLEILGKLAKANPTGLTATQKKALVAVSEKTSGNSVESFAALMAVLTKKKQPARKTKPKAPSMSAGAMAQIVSELETLSRNQSEFESKIDRLNKAHSAPELKKIASAFAAGARPKTKPEAVRILKAERNDRERAAVKAAEAGNARPW
ncbi:MAG: hypothetical protein ABJH52_02130 [Henriciella sp.]